MTGTANMFRPSPDSSSRFAVRGGIFGVRVNLSSVDMDSHTEIASDFTVGRYLELRSKLSVQTPNTPEWHEVLWAFKRRIRERFLKPIASLARYDHESVRRMVPGFAILSLDCLLIDTIQSFREGRVLTGEVSPAASFKSFLKSPKFSAFSATDRNEFFKYVRNALLHNGETRKDWKIRFDSDGILEKDSVTGTRTINRRRFHAAVVSEFRLLFRVLESQAEARRLFLRRMDALCGLPVAALRNLYFAYGSNLLERELKRDAEEAEAVGVAFLPCYRLEFTKHAESRSGDAASIREHAASVVWGFVYRMHDADRAALRAREKGYREIPEVTVYLKDGDGVTPQDVFTFIGAEACGRNCGPSQAYYDLVLEGARARGLPDQYIEEVAGRVQPRAY